MLFATFRKKSKSVNHYCKFVFMNFQIRLERCLESQQNASQTIYKKNIFFFFFYSLGLRSKLGK